MENKIKVLKTMINPVLFLIIILGINTVLSSAYASTKQWPLRSKGEVRYLKMIKIYDIGLYSPSLVTAENILNPNISKCLKLDYRVGLTVDKFKLATSKILKRQYSPEYLATIKSPFDILQKAYLAVKKGDSYTVCYNGRNQIMQLTINDIKLVEIKSAELASAYLGIWLSKNKPISSSLYRTFFPNRT